jgi:hypothetical protein
LPIVQSSTTVKVAVSDLTAGRAVSALSYTSTTGATFATSSGNVGVGVASPAAKLDLSANAVIMGYFRSSGGSANDQRLTITSGGGRVVLDAATNSTGASSALGFTLGGTEGMRLISTGLGIGTTAPNASAKLDVQSTTQGVRMPNMTTVQKNAIASPAAGLMVFDTTLAKLCVYSGAAWQTITSI